MLVLCLNSQFAIQTAPIVDLLTLLRGAPSIKEVQKLISHDTTAMIAVRLFQQEHSRQRSIKSARILTILYSDYSAQV